MRFLLISLFITGLLKSSEAASQAVPTAIPDSLKKPITLRVLPQNFYTQHLSFMCNTEIKIQKATSLPIYFRLGSKEAVDYMERKPNAIKRF